MLFHFEPFETTFLLFGTKDGGGNLHKIIILSSNYLKKNKNYQ